jgi:hypothetical protein
MLVVVVRLVILVEPEVEDLVGLAVVEILPMMVSMQLLALQIQAVVVALVEVQPWIKMPPLAVVELLL